MNKTVFFAIIMIALFSTLIIYKAYKRFWGIKEKFQIGIFEISKGDSSSILVEVPTITLKSRSPALLTVEIVVGDYYGQTPHSVPELGFRQRYYTGTAPRYIDVTGFEPNKLDAQEININVVPNTEYAIRIKKWYIPTDGTARVPLFVTYVTSPATPEDPANPEDPATLATLQRYATPTSHETVDKINVSTTGSYVQNKNIFFFEDIVSSVVNGGDKNGEGRFYKEQRAGTADYEEIKDIVYIYPSMDSSAPNNVLLLEYSDQSSNGIIQYLSVNRRDIYLTKDGLLKDLNYVEIPVSFQHVNESIIMIDYKGDPGTTIWILSNYHKVYELDLGSTPLEWFENVTSNMTDVIVKICGNTVSGGLHMLSQDGNVYIDDTNSAQKSGIVDIRRYGSLYVWVNVEGNIYSSYNHGASVAILDPKLDPYKAWTITVSSTDELILYYIYGETNMLHRSIVNSSGEITGVPHSDFYNIKAIVTLQNGHIACLCESVEIVESVEECPVNFVEDPSNPGQCSNCPYYQKRDYGETACSPMDCSFILNSNTCLTGGDNIPTVCYTENMPERIYDALVSSIDLSNLIGYSNVPHLGTGLSFNTSDSNCVGYVYASNLENNDLIRYPGVSNNDNIIPSSAHIHYKSICFENSNLINDPTLSIQGCSTIGNEPTLTNSEPDPHCPYMTKVVSSSPTDYKTCEDIPCWLSFKANIEQCTPFDRVCGQIHASNIPYYNMDTGSGDFANQYSLHILSHITNNKFLGTNYYYNWNRRNEYMAENERNIQLVTDVSSNSSNCGVSVYTYPKFNDLISAAEDVTGGSVDPPSIGAYVEISAGTTSNEIPGYYGSNLSSVCFYDPSRPDSKNICAHTQDQNSPKVFWSQE